MYACTRRARFDGCKTRHTSSRSEASGVYKRPLTYGVGEIVGPALKLIPGISKMTSSRLLSIE
jgi:hypothetical protein